MKKVALHTLGCKLNFSETSTIGRQFLERGFTIVEADEPADVFVLNTCSVTERADRECRQIIRRTLRSSPETYIIVTGCYAQLQPQEIASIQGVDLILGSGENSISSGTKRRSPSAPSPAIRLMHRRHPLLRTRIFFHRGGKDPGVFENPGRMRLLVRLLHDPPCPGSEQEPGHRFDCCRGEYTRIARIQGNRSYRSERW